jgi:Flp pilus assembly pilin Flp
MKKLLAAVAGDVRGTAALDYALIAALIVIGLVAVMGQFGDNVGNSFGSTANHFADSESE